MNEHKGTLRLATHEATARCSNDQLSRLIDTVCKEIADADQEYHEANTQEGWRSIFETEKPMTKKQIMEKYGDVPLDFVSYYKYEFAFVGKAPDGARVGMTYGGDSNDIYKYEVSASKTVTLREYANDYCHAAVTKDGTELWSDHP